MENKLGGVYPEPPKYYKMFNNTDTFSPPDLSSISKFENFSLFGIEYTNIKYSNPIESELLGKIDPQTLEQLKIPNQILFNNPKLDFEKVRLDSLNFNVIDAIGEEISFTRRIYFELVKEMKTNLEKAEMYSNLIKFTFQKIYFLISLLKRKKVLIDVLKYFKSEMDYNDNLDNKLSNNLNKLFETLQNGLTKIKQDLKGHIDIK